MVGIGNFKLRGLLVIFRFIFRVILDFHGVFVILLCLDSRLWLVIEKEIDGDGIEIDRDG